MKLDATKFAISSAFAFAVLWVLCSILVWLAPAMMATMTGHMLHIDMAAWPWVLTLGGAITGLVAWAIAAGITGGFIAVTYNFLTRGS
jgi:hypothetical protein